MSARQKAQERDFNRRRKLILDKGFDLARNQLDTKLGQCLVYDNIKENERLREEFCKLKKRECYQMNHEDAKLRHFVFWRDRGIKEPIVLCEREPTNKTIEDLLEMTRPRYMKRRENQRTPSPSFSTFSLFRAHTKRNLNYWEKPAGVQVRFRAALAPTPVLTANEFLGLREGWRKQQDSRRRCLTPPSHALRKERHQRVFRTPSQQSISTTSEAAKLSTPSESEDESENESESENDKTRSVFVTALPNHKCQSSIISRNRRAEPRARVHFQEPRSGNRVRPMTVAIGRREDIHIQSVCKDPDSVAILQQVIRSRSR